MRVICAYEEEDTCVSYAHMRRRIHAHMYIYEEEDTCTYVYIYEEEDTCTYVYI